MSVHWEYGHSTSDLLFRGCYWGVSLYHNMSVMIECNEPLSKCTHSLPYTCTPADPKPAIYDKVLYDSGTY